MADVGPDRDEAGRDRRLPISVIICTYNRAGLLKMTLESFALQTLSRDRYEIVVIDDGSSDGTRQCVESFAGKLPVRYFFQRNAGLASAKNHGIFAAEGEILFFMDDDDVAAPTLLEEHLKTHGKYPGENYAVLNYTTWAPDLHVTPLMHFVTEVGCFLFYYPYIKHGDVLDYTNFWGGRSSCKRSFLIEHGIFNPVFRFGCEDIELGYRLSEHGLRVVYNSKAVSYMTRPVGFDDFCSRLVKQGRSQYVFSSLHDDKAVHEWAEMIGAEKRWAKITDFYEAKKNAARGLDRIANAKLQLHLGLDDATRELLYQAYWWVFRACKLKGIAEGRELAVSGRVLSAIEITNGREDTAQSPLLRNIREQLHDKAARLVGDGPVFASLMRDRPKFHDDGFGNPISWNANIRLLRFLDAYLQPGMHTLETGSGYSTVMFIGKKCTHVALTPARSEFERITAYCKEKDISLDRAELIAKDSTEYLPHIQGKELDVLFVDGAHNFPLPIVDWFYGARLLKKGGIAVVDDTDIIACFILQKFLEQDTHWETLIIERDFAVFKKLEEHIYPGDWPKQVFSRNKIDGAETFLKVFFKEHVVQTSSVKIPSVEMCDRGSALSIGLKGLAAAAPDCSHEITGGVTEFTGGRDVAIMQQPAIDHTRTFNYEKLVREEIEEYSNIEVTEDLREGGIHAQKAWGYWFRYLAQNVWKTSLVQEIIESCHNIESPRILSLGCGYCGAELEIARSLQSLNKQYEIVAVDINSSLFSRAEKEVRAKGFNMRFVSLDLNFVELRENFFDVIFAHASLHHLLNLEHVFWQIHRGLKGTGRLVIQDIIGKTQILFWKENIDFAREVVKKMPLIYKGGIAGEDIIPPYSEPSVQKGMEGIRQEEIEEQVNKYFAAIKMFRYGSFIRLICTHPELGKRFDPEKKEDREYLEYLFRLDLQQIEEGKLRASEMLAVYGKKAL